MAKINLIKIIIPLLSVFICLSVVSKEYTPSDVFAEALLIEKSIKQWKIKQDLPSHWTKVPVEPGYKPRHVFQKAIELLEKVNHYRVNVIQTGAIPVSHFVGRDITPSDVFIEVHRVREELLAMFYALGLTFQQTSLTKVSQNKSPSDVFAKLSEISIAMEELLGLRGITPSDVYDRSRQLVLLAKFLRRSQNLSVDIPPPIRTEHKFPNHTLEAVQALIFKIEDIEKNLSLDPVQVIKVPRRVISPSDVYGSMGIALAELLRIQHHLGLEKYFPISKTGENKTADDIIFNINTATLLIPDFANKEKLQRYDIRLLTKTPNHVYSLTHYILNELEQYCRFKGINLPIQPLPNIARVRPKHVYAKALEAIDMIVQIRVNHALARSAIPRYPLRNITPQEVFNISLRIDEFLNIIFQDSDMVATPWVRSENIKYFSNKTPSDVYINIWKITELLKVILGNQGITLDHLFYKMNNLNNELDLILASLALPIKINQMAPAQSSLNQKDISLADILSKIKHLQKLIIQIKVTEGIQDNSRISLPQGNEVTIEEVYSRIWQLETEISTFKLALGIEIIPIRIKMPKGKTLKNNYTEVSLFEQKLLSLPPNFLHKLEKDI